MENNDLLITSSQTAQQFSCCLWDYNTKNVQKTYRNGGTVAPKSLELVGQDFILTSESTKPLLHIWPLNSQEPAKNTRLILPEPATCLAISPENAYLAVGMSNKLYIWQISSGKLLSVQQKHYQPISCIKFSSDSTYVIIGGEDGILIVYYLADLVAISNNLLSQSSIGQIDPLYTKNDHAMPISDLHVGVFGRKSRFATVSSDHTCKLYLLSTGELLLNLVFNEAISSVIFDSPCWQLYVGTNSGNIKFFDLKTPPRSLDHHVNSKDNSRDFLGHKKKVTALALNSLNTILASGSLDNFVYTWELTSRQILQKFEHKEGITNVKFVLNSKHFFEQNFKPKIVFKSLQRNLDVNDDKFTVSLFQDYDIELSDDENSLEKERSRENLVSENTRLRIANNKLYKAALDISKKYNNCT